MQNDTPIMAALRAILTLVGTFLIGHVIAGHTITTDLWQLVLGVAAAGYGVYAEITSSNATPVMVQNAWISLITAIGGVLLSMGVVNQQVWASIMGVATAIIPLFIKQTTKQTVMHLMNNKAVGDKLTGAVTKKVAIILLLVGFGTMAHAQSKCDPLPADSTKYMASGVWNWSIGELKEVAKTSYFWVMDMINQKVEFTKEGFDTALNQYEYWRTLVDLKLSNKEDRDEFHNWIVREARAAGKLTYKEDDKPLKVGEKITIEGENPNGYNSGTTQYSYISNITLDTAHEWYSIDNMPSGDFYFYGRDKSQSLFYEGHRQNYSTGFKYFLKHKPDPTHLHLLSGKLGDPPTGIDTTTYQGWEPVASVVVYAYSPVLKTWVSLAGVGIAYSKYVWKKSTTSSGRWYCQWSIAGLGYGGGGLGGSTPATPTSVMGVGAVGASVSLFDKHVSVGGGYDIINKGGLITVGTSFSFLN